MSDIGSQLRQAREAHGLSLEDIQKTTRIKRVYLEALEAEQFHELPGIVQTRGFIRSYASRLDLDADALLAQLEDTPDASGYVTQPLGTLTGSNHKPGRPSSSMAPSGSTRKGIEPAAALPLPLPILIIAVILLFIIGGLLILQAFTAAGPAPAPSRSANVSTSIGQLPTPTPIVVASGQVSLTLTANEHVWVRVTEDGFTAFEGTLRPGEMLSWQAEEQVIVETGNAAGLTVAVNGEPLGVLGPRNHVVIRAWSPEGEVTPAPTALPPLNATPNLDAVEPTPTP